MQDLFTPVAATVRLDVTTDPASIALPDPKIGAVERTIRVLNAGDQTVFLAFGGPEVTAAAPGPGAPANGLPVPPGHSPEAFRIPADATHAAALTEAGTALLYLTLGMGA
jgi:hypothetical protein